MAQINEKSVVRKKENIPLKEIDGETIILNLENGDYFAMNETGGLIWKALDGTTDLEGVAKKIALCYNINREQCLLDVLKFTDVLYRGKLVLIA